jgi:hypothetical protein
LFPWLINNHSITSFIKRLPAGERNTRKWCVLDDYFQNLLFMEQGVREVVAKIAGTARLDQAVTAEFTRLLEGYLPAEVAAVHIRRSDYLDKPNRKWFYLLGQEYYSVALAKLGPGIKKIVIFTDAVTGPVPVEGFIQPGEPVQSGEPVQPGDSAQCEGFIQWPENTIIIYRAGKNFSACSELLLFSLFTNLVIANSTFSFWAAISAGTNSSDPSDRVKIGPAHWSLDKRANEIWNANLRMTGFILL